MQNQLIIALIIFFSVVIFLKYTFPKEIKRKEIKRQKEIIEPRTVSIKCEYAVNRYQNGKVKEICIYGRGELNSGKIRIENGEIIEAFALKIPYEKCGENILFYYAFIVKNIHTAPFDCIKQWYFNVEYNGMNLKCYIGDNGDIIQK
ncbi:MAG: hypothetical protein ACLRZ9_05770 [Eubacterium sp.]